jgi:hypothetical protein
VALHGGERIEVFLKWADDIADHAEAKHQMFSDGGRPSITAVTYLDRPWAGWTFGVTYGASLHTPSSVELVTVVRSGSPLWTWAIADFVDRHRGDVHELGIEDTINWREPIAEDSGMDAFVIVPPISLDPELHVVHLDTDDHVQLLPSLSE